MLFDKKIVIVLPAYNAGLTLQRTYQEIPRDIVDEIILVDDASTDDTVVKAHSIGINHVIQHKDNLGYGANQKSCYKKALELDADIIIMLHPDYQYTPKLIYSMCYLMAQDLYPVVIGSRILGNGAKKGGMPTYKYYANRFLTLFQNLLCGQKLSEYHSGYRGYTREVLESINLDICSDDFIFDNQVLSQIIYAGYEIAEITCPTKYFEEASSINLRRSIRYGFGVLATSIMHGLQRYNIIRFELYSNVKKASLSKPDEAKSSTQHKKAI